jgi:predicted TIM-barrel fold metal-dependent hydrolase
MLIVDAQIHLWNAGKPTTPWHRQIPAYLKSDALAEMDAGGVDAAVLTPHTPWDPKANELCIEAARQHPDRFVILGNSPLDKPESRALVESWKQRPGMLGLRFTFPPPEQSKCRGAGCEWRNVGRQLVRAQSTPDDICRR